MTTGRALVALALRGIKVEAEERENLEAAYGHFMDEPDPKGKGEAGNDLICATFGREALAEDSIR